MPLLLGILSMALAAASFPVDGWAGYGLSAAGIAVGAAAIALARHRIKQADR